MPYSLSFFPKMTTFVNGFMKMLVFNFNYACVFSELLTILT